MAALNRHLRRFWRLVSPPGRPGPAGVPVDRVRLLSDELEDVFASIDAVQQDAERIGNDARQAAQQRLDEAEERVERILSDARSRAEQERAEAQARHRSDIREEIGAMLAAAERQAETIRARSDANLDAAAARIIERLLEAEIAEGD